MNQSSGGVVGMGSLTQVGLEVYRSCSFSEKREVLDAFWRQRGEHPYKIMTAALQYGPYAVGSLLVVIAELAFIGAIFATHHSALLWVAVVVEVATLWSTWWAVVRLRALHHTTDT